MPDSRIDGKAVATAQERLRAPGLDNPAACQHCGSRDVAREPGFGGWLTLVCRRCHRRISSERQGEA